MPQQLLRKTVNGVLAPIDANTSSPSAMITIASMMSPSEAELTGQVFVDSSIDGQVYERTRIRFDGIAATLMCQVRLVGSYLRISGHSTPGQVFMLTVDTA